MPDDISCIGNQLVDYPYKCSDDTELYKLFGLVSGKFVVVLSLTGTLAPVPAILRTSELTLTHAKEHELEKAGAVKILN